MKTVSCLLLSALLLVGTSSLRADDDLSVDYVAKLSARDHQASDGYDLTEAADIIRQDRANFYKFGKKDREDQDDGYFNTEAHRAEIAKLLKAGSTSKEVLRAIVNGTPTVRVSVYTTENDRMYMVVRLEE